MRAARANTTCPVSGAILHHLKGVDNHEDADELDESVAQDLGAVTVEESLHNLESVYLSTLLRMQNTKIDTFAPRQALPASLATTLDLIVHKQPGLDIVLFVDGEHGVADLVTNTLGGRSSLKCYRTLTLATSYGGLVVPFTEQCAKWRQANVHHISYADSGDLPEYDLAVVVQSSPARDIDGYMNTIKPKLRESGRLFICQGSTELDNELGYLLDSIATKAAAERQPRASDLTAWTSVLEKNAFDVSKVDRQPSGWTLLASSPKVTEKVSTGKIVILSRHQNCDASSVFGSTFNRECTTASRAHLDDPAFQAIRGATYVSIVEFGDDLFENMTETELANLQAIAESASAVFWTTTGDRGICLCGVLDHDRRSARPDQCSCCYHHGSRADAAD